MNDAWIHASSAVHAVCKYIDMPLQHISNLVLLAMNRPPQVGNDSTDSSNTCPSANLNQLGAFHPAADSTRGVSPVWVVVTASATPCTRTQDHTLKLLQRLRDGIPGLALRTTFISG
jgi:hypothetical protein